MSVCRVEKAAVIIRKPEGTQKKAHQQQRLPAGREYRVTVLVFEKWRIMFAGSDPSVAIESGGQSVVNITPEYQGPTAALSVETDPSVGRCGVRSDARESTSSTKRPFAVRLDWEGDGVDTVLMSARAAGCRPWRVQSMGQDQKGLASIAEGTVRVAAQNTPPTAGLSIEPLVSSVRTTFLADRLN